MSARRSDDGTTKQPTSVRRVVVASLVGTSLEWYDFFIYGTAAALVFGDLFFSDAVPGAGTLIAFATFGVGFVARPFGGILFGHLGDRIGRRETLIITTPLILVGLAVAFAFRAGLFNIGGQGQYTVGGIAAVSACSMSSASSTASRRKSSSSVAALTDWRACARAANAAIVPGGGCVRSGRTASSRMSRSSGRSASQAPRGTPGVCSVIADQRKAAAQPCHCSRRLPQCERG